MSFVAWLKARAFGILIVWSQKRTRMGRHTGGGVTNSQQHAISKLQAGRFYWQGRCSWSPHFSSAKRGARPVRSTSSRIGASPVHYPLRRRRKISDTMRGRARVVHRHGPSIAWSLGSQRLQRSLPAWLRLWQRPVLRPIVTVALTQTFCAAWPKPAAESSATRWFRGSGMTWPDFDIRERSAVTACLTAVAVHSMSRRRPGQ